MMVSGFQSIIGTKGDQMQKRKVDCPSAVACIGGGSKLHGLFHHSYLDDTDVEIYGVGRLVTTAGSSGKHARSLAGGRAGVLSTATATYLPEDGD